MKKYLAVLLLTVSVIALFPFHDEALAAAKWKTGIAAAPVNGRHPIYQALLFLDEEISTATGGKYGVEIFHSGQLGGERDIMEGVQLGTYKFGAVPSSYTAALSDIFLILELPYLFKDYDHFIRVLRSDIGKEMLATLEDHNLVGLGFCINGIYSLCNGKRPVLKASDLGGLKIRAMDAPIQLECVNTLGGRGVPMAWGEVYTGLQQGTIDGVLTINSGFSSARLFEVNKHLTMLQIFMLPSPILVNKDYWESLPEADRAQIMEGVRKAEDRHYVDFLAQDDEALDICKKEGMQIVTEFDRASFETALEPVYEKYQGEYGDIVRRIRAMAGE